MVKEILIIEDEKAQAEGLKKALQQELSSHNFSCVFEEEKMIYAIENKFFNLAIVDLRMDKFSINGIELIEKIIEVNPFSKIIIVSAYLVDFFLLNCTNIGFIEYDIFNFLNNVFKIPIKKQF